MYFVRKYINAIVITVRANIQKLTSSIESRNGSEIIYVLDTLQIQACVIFTYSSV